MRSGQDRLRDCEFRLEPLLLHVLFYDGYVGYGNGLMSFSPNQCPIPGGSACAGTPAFAARGCSDNDCEQWWTKSRTYTCTTSGYDFSQIQKRAQTVTSSAGDDTSTMGYNDYLLQGSTWVTQTTTYVGQHVWDLRELSTGVQDGRQCQQQRHICRLHEKRYLPRHDEPRVLLPRLHDDGVSRRAGKRRWSPTVSA